MRRWGLASVTCFVVGAPLAARAQEAGGTQVSATAEAAEPATPDQAIGYGAMPGGIHVAAADTLPKGVAEIATLAGYGYRGGLLGPDHSLSRALGDFAVAYSPIRVLSIGLSLDGRYDHHSGGPAPASRSGYVGDPHLFVRVAKELGSVHLGGQLGVWTPGHAAPSFVAGATSVDLRLLASIAVGPGLLSIDAGYQLDNSIKSADAPTISMLPLQYRVSLGVSDFDEVYGGASIVFPAGASAWVGVETSVEAFVGSPKGYAGGDTTIPPQLTNGSLIVRGAAFGGYRITPMWAVIGFVEAAKVPSIGSDQVANMSIPIVPYEPTITAGVGLQVRFGAKKSKPVEIVHKKKCFEHVPPDCQPVVTDLFTDFTGSVVDENDKPIAGAKVTLKLSKTDVPPVVTDEQGTYKLSKVRIGTTSKTEVAPGKYDEKDDVDEPTGEITVESDNKKTAKASVSPKKDGNDVPVVKLEPDRPGQLQVTISGPGGKPIAGATVTVGAYEAKTDQDGKATIALAPGSYKVAIKASGFASQQLPFTIDPPNGVAIKQVTLHK